MSIEKKQVFTEEERAKLLNVRINRQNREIEALKSDRQKAHNVKCDECGKIYLSYRSSCPSCGSTKRHKD